MTTDCRDCRRKLSPEHVAAGLSEHRHHAVQDAALNAVTTGFCAVDAGPDDGLRAVRDAAVRALPDHPERERMTDAELGSWVRIKPSGDVHLVTATATTALRVMACGVDRL